MQQSDSIMVSNLTNFEKKIFNNFLFLSQRIPTERLCDILKWFNEPVLCVFILFLLQAWIMNSNVLKSVL